MDDIANGITYFRTNANQVTGAGRAYNALDSSNEYVKSLTSTKLTVVGSNPTNGWVGDANGIRMYQGGTLKVNIPVSGSPDFTGDISGGSNINITGTGKFNGLTLSSGNNYAGVFNESQNAPYGLIGWAGTNGIGVSGAAAGAGVSSFGVSGTNSSGVGVIGSATNGTGVRASASLGTALDVVGKMKISSTALVSNLNADQVDGFHASSFAKLSGGNTFSGDQTFPNNITVTGLVRGGDFRTDQAAVTGTATATFPGNNKPGSTTTVKFVPFTVNGVFGHMAWWPNV
ncbi:hypothetical protein R2083_08050 [Nitrosomonas sp. Is35]|uniref:hypothetical protein n=1 Tax=Nitrosomonas sp. Is35 TaxID=3080534 RepID=UPI00294AD34A|nr:hypothetical protein [Nitrosomonas sp. Is35]MDV6347465.1 hypothetical protein [Nitrosomonas sp. Is35]